MDLVQQPLVSFVVLAYKERDLLRLHIQRILDLHLDAHNIAYEIIFVDNGSRGMLSDMVRSSYPSVRIVENEKNVGHPAGNNAGLRVARGQYIFMMNPDVICTDWHDIARIVEYMDQHADIGILGPQLHNPDGSIQMSCFRRYSRWTPLYRRTFLKMFRFAQKDITRHLMLDDDHSKTQDVEWLLGACFCIRADAMNTVGMMDADYFLYFGDYDWCDRMQKAGMRTVYFAETQRIVHYHKRESASSRFSIMQLFSPVTRIHLKDWMTYLRKHRV